jgi:hypothetical protein
MVRQVRDLLHQSLSLCHYRASGVYVCRTYQSIFLVAVILYGHFVVLGHAIKTNLDSFPSCR